MKCCIAPQGELEDGLCTSQPIGSAHPGKPITNARGKADLAPERWHQSQSTFCQAEVQLGGRCSEMFSVQRNLILFDIATFWKATMTSTPELW